VPTVEKHPSIYLFISIAALCGLHSVSIFSTFFFFFVPPEDDALVQKKQESLGINPSG